MVQLLADKSFAQLIANMLTRVFLYRRASRVPRPLTVAPASSSRTPVLLIMYRSSGKLGSRVPAVVKVVGIRVARSMASIMNRV